jgi:exonuclease SbcD
MTDFRFLHAADIHLDSPLHGLARYEGVPVNDVRGATRTAFDTLISTALEQEVDFVILAGDVFDGDWKDMGTGLYFARALGRLGAAKIPVFLLHGNHDAASVLTKALPLPENVRVFSSRKPQTFILEELGVAVHGRSFPTAHVTDNLAKEYPAPSAGKFNIGVLHTAVAGYTHHQPYAPCSVQELVAKGYSYWALGHVHEHQILHESPWIVFPGNLQGRSIRETGAKGAVLVDVADGVVSSVEHVAVDALRWLRVEVSCNGIESQQDLVTAMRAALTTSYSEGSSGRPAIVRILLKGETSLHGALQGGAAQLRDEFRAIALHVSSDLWIEKISLMTTAPPATEAAAPGRDDFAALLAEAVDDPDLARVLAEDLGPLVAALPDAGEAGEAGIVGSALSKDWAGILAVGAAALRARLTKDAV